MITQEFVNTVGEALAENCPKASLSPEAIERIKSKILSYDEKIGPPDVSVVLSWGREEERRLQAVIDTENAAYETERGRIDARRRAIADDLAPANKEEVLLELRQRVAEHPKRLSFKPARIYTNDEIDAMSADEYKEKVLGDDRVLGRQPQGDTTTTYLTPERPGTRKGRTVKFPAEEIASREYRSRVIEQDKNERKALQKALRQGLMK